MALIKAVDILSGKVKMPETKTSTEPEKDLSDLGDALEAAGFTAMAGHPGVRRGRSNPKEEADGSEH